LLRKINRGYLLGNQLIEKKMLHNLVFKKILKNDDFLLFLKCSTKLKLFEFYTKKKIPAFKFLQIGKQGFLVCHIWLSVY